MLACDGARAARASHPLHPVLRELFAALEKWTPNLDEIAAFASCPWVVQSSVSPLGVNLADTLRSQPERHAAALALLRHLGKEVDTVAGVQLEDISENEWAATVSSSNAPPDTVAEQRSKSRLIRGAQHFVQQCLDVRIPEIPLEKCWLAEEDGRRSYPLTYESPTQVPLVPNHPREAERGEWIKRYKLHEPDLTVSEEVALICDLAAKEMEADIGVATAVLGDRQWFIPPVRHDSDSGVLVNERKQSFSSHALLSGNKPLLVRNAQLDVRFRHYKVATATSGLSFFGAPVLAGDGVIVATLCALDSKPRRSVTTMQYSVMTALAKALAAVWRDEFDAPESDDEMVKDAPWTLRLRSPRGSASD
ncbi:hypothetical protein PF005_g20562 [Phytophthora fragariae]|uniref:GAF domain-containing protein n=1 Tax=Phytophthora fragariae TaxID=53985 RepID=A0A6A3S658_9STRA|nr:hypothetical protein PF003_g20186 [Phytophthora fragariae]KAE8927425.1 hypothetical protein PF009_g22405 [Phytophthora fragariae]KAE8986139.1 hypothetical protein PF011_g20115 [Phytophthora fragariae]KAE9083202.1 hypothetical protein PF007_g21998 [Phytophthora fragariae]KAE9087328.1 hypothetical protein PF010_g19772 [Phytophthora fragariae]